MKIAVYDVMDFEYPILARIKEEGKAELILTEKRLDKESMDFAAGCDGVTILGPSVMDRGLLEELKNRGISYLSTRTIGFDHIDVQAAKELGIHVSNASYEPYNVADFTVMLMLMLLRKTKVSICRALVNDFSLGGMQGREMRNMTVGVVGTGKIGSHVVRNLTGFGCRLLACDKYPSQAVAEDAEYVSLEKIYQEGDIITLHTPLTDENYHMIDKEAISKMKDGVILINTARGALIDTEDLISALESGKVGGAGIDTLEEEKGIVHHDIGTDVVEERSLFYLKQFPNVVFTQHYAFFTAEACESMVRCGIDSLCLGAGGAFNPYEIR